MPEQDRHPGAAASEEGSLAAPNGPGQAKVAVPGEDVTTADAVALERQIESRLKREHPVVFWVTLLVPVLGWVGLLAFLQATRGKQFVLKVLAITLLVEAVVGRFVIITGGGSAEGATVLLSRAELFWLVAWIDLCVATLFLYHATFIYRLWKVGPWLERVRNASRELLARRPLLGRFSFVGVVVYVGLPVLGSGAILGSMLGQLLGLRRLTTLAAVTLGTLLGNSLMLLLAEAVMSVPFLQRQHPAVLLGTLVVFAGVIGAVQWRMHRPRGAARDARRSASEGGR